MQRFIPCALAASMLASCSTTLPFDRADLNRDSRLNPTEFRTFLVNERFDQLDANTDGRVSPPEWSSGHPATDKSAFASRDLNSDGFVGRDEAHASARRLGTSDSIFQQVDANRDGFVEKAEDEAYARKAQAGALRSQ